ncbi:MAG TPA: cytochrome c [Nitrospira sp.]
MMHKTSRTLGFAACISLLLGALPVAAQDLPADLPRGKALYQNHCATCHGQTGWGDGPTAASLRVAPANFHLFRSFLKSDEELLRTIEHGIVFSPMHAWTGSLTEGQMIDVLAYVRLLSQQGQ